MQPSYRPDRAKWSDRAHHAATKSIYRQLWPDCRVEFERVVDTDYDYKLGVDYVAHVRGPFPRPLRIYIQERFRDPKAAKGYSDVTVTEINTRTGTDSELYKIAAHLFVYGIWDEPAQRFRRTMVVYVDRLLQALVTRRLTYGRVRDNGKGQSFVTVRMNDLINAGCSAFYLAEGEDDLLKLEQLPDGQLRIVVHP